MGEAMSPAPVLLALSLSLGPPGPPPDRWFAEDKLRHFFASFVVTSISAGAARAAGLDPAASAWAGAGVGAGAGVAKEIRDGVRGRGTPSFRDLLWDAVGIAASAIVAGQVR
jgi:uncharacterized protein YfiM (DUF2279 family)